MSINGINSYGMGYYNYQSSINNMRLAQALSRNQRFQQSVNSSYSSNNSTLKSSMTFVKQYNSSMSNLMSAANKLKLSNNSGTMNTYAVTSSDEAVATATAKLTVRNPKDIALDVTQLAQAQTNVSSGVTGADAAASDMNFTVGNAASSINVQVSAANADGSTKTNIQMLREAADQINTASSNVKASVVEKDGVASLELTGKSTGSANGFQVTGELGAAAGAEKAATAAQNAKYSVTVDGKTTERESYSNDIYLDSTRISASLKGVGKATISAAVDSKKVASDLSNLVDAYNSSLKLLNDNYDRGTGVDRQLRSLVAGLGSEKSLEQLGITVNKDATLKFDQEQFEKNMKKNPSLTRDLISGTAGIAETAFTKASNGLNTRSSTLINGDIANAQYDAMNSPFNVFSMYARNGAYNMNNYAATGMMLNYLI